MYRMRVTPRQQRYARRQALWDSFAEQILAYRPTSSLFFPSNTGIGLYCAEAIPLNNNADDNKPMFL
jgi:hypothetical protein